MGSRPIISSVTSWWRTTDGIQLLEKGRRQAYPKTKCSWEVINPVQEGDVSEKAPSRTLCKVLAKGCPTTRCLGLHKGVAKGQVWMEMSLIWHLRHLGNLLAFHQHLCHSLGWKTHSNSLWRVAKVIHAAGASSLGLTLALSLLLVSWQEPANYEQGQLVSQAAIYSASLFSCIHLSLPRTARLMKANEKKMRLSSPDGFFFLSPNATRVIFQPSEGIMMTPPLNHQY